MPALLRFKRLAAIVALACAPFLTADGHLLGQTRPAPTGRRHALLIGISKYPQKPLEGPPYDVTSLATALRTTYHFDTVRTLVDAQATHDGILAALDDLAVTTQPDDFIFIYYSGHGTSVMDRALHLPGLQSYTGALLPAGFKPGPDRDMLRQVIIGSRDLRPRIARLDRDRTVFVVFDTCFSAYTVRSLRVDGGGLTRAMPWDKLTPKSMDFGNDDVPAEFGKESEAHTPYPYNNTIYLAAAGSGEEANDIASWELRRHPTVDGQPHGALTNALLKGLAGQANTNGDGMISYRELRDYVTDQVTREFPHRPQMSVPEGRDDLLDRPVFNARAAVPAAPELSSSGLLRVIARSGEVDEVTRAALRTIGGLMMVETGPHDLRVAPMRGGQAVLHGSGDVIEEITGAPGYVRDKVVERVRRQARAQELLSLRFPGQSFNVSIDLSAPRGYLVVDELVPIRCDTEQPGYILLVNVDVTGYVTIMSPSETDRGDRAKGRLTSQSRVSEPTGTEFVKAIVFRQRPPGFESWIGRQFEADSQDFTRLMAMIQSAPGARAQALLKLVTARGPMK